MKRKEFRKQSGIALSVFLLACLSGCVGKSTVAEGYWKNAQKAKSLEEYVTEHKDELDLEVLKQEASSGESSASQKFKATALLCAIEYQGQAEENSSWVNRAFQVDYPDSSQYAKQYLDSVNTQGEEFWKALGDSFSPYDCFWPMIAAADDLDGQTVVNIINGIPEGSKYGSKLKEAMDEWVKEKPIAVPAVGDALEESGYYNGWTEDDWKSVYFYTSSRPDRIQAKTMDEAIAYIAYMRDTLVPRLESGSNGRFLKSESSLLGEDWFDTDMMVTVGETLELQETQENLQPEEGQEGENQPEEEAAPEGEVLEEGQAEGIQIEGKKVIACYRNLQSEEFKGFASPLQVMGDFMMGLPAEEFPASVAEADYLLVLTPNLEYGDYYQTYGGNDTNVQQIVSSTSVDLYEASTRTLIRHIGNVMELPPESIMTNRDQTVEYPDPTSADVLHYIYHHINEPDAYATLLDHTSGKSMLEKDEEIILGNWSIVYHSGQVIKEFDEGMYRYTADEGYQFARCSFTITNKGTENDGFMPMLYRVGEDPIIQLVNTNGDEEYDCVDLITNGKCLVGTYLDPGESKEGELYFQIPEDMVSQTANLSLKVSLGKQEVCYPMD